MWELRKVQIWRVRLNINLRARSVEELLGVRIRKELHEQMAQNAIAEVAALLDRVCPIQSNISNSDPCLTCVRNYQVQSGILKTRRICALAQCFRCALAR